MDIPVDIGRLKIGTVYKYQGELHWEEIELDVGRCPVVAPIKVNMQYRLDKDGLKVLGSVQTVLLCPCSRCLETFKLPIKGCIEAIYRPFEVLKEQKNVEEKLEKLENVVYYSTPVVDLAERVLEAIVVEVPQKLLCKPDCKGLCQYCGKNLNEDPDHKCTEKSGVVDPRWVVLQEIKSRIAEGG